MPDESEIVKARDGAPCIGVSGPPVARVIHQCHERSIVDGRSECGADGVSDDDFEAVLTYCAEQRCMAAGLVCPGCKLETEQLGIHDFDQFVAGFSEIAVEDSGVRLVGPGEARLSIASLGSLANSWAGEAYWFWARRVIRKLRHGIRRAHIKGRAFAGDGETPSILLMEPQLADNIGMVARAMANFGLDDLRVINPRDGWPNEKARIAASGANFVIDDASAYECVDDAFGDLHWVCATTARQRDLAKPVLTPEQAVLEMARRIGQGERCGILFGRERNGLETDEVANADAIVMIPVNPSFASLNLAQAVLLLGYEWMKRSDRGTLGRVTTYETAREAGLHTRGSAPADHSDLAGLFEHLEEELDRAGFFNPPHKRQSVVRNLRTMFLRMGATKQEVQTLRGIVATLARARRSGKELP